MQYQSDYLGRMQWIIYPDGEKIIYGYDEGGQVTSVTGNHYNQTFPYVTKILYDQYGQRTRIEYGNGTATDYTYNPERRWLETVKTKNKYGQSYQNIRYDFDRVGNVRSYVNDCMDTLSGNYKTDQSYEYDDLYQLIHVTGNTEYYPAISSVPDYKSTYTQDFAFDDKGLGNMMSKVSKETVSPLKVIGDNLNYNIGYVYDENYAHRLVQAGNRYYKYDANGNIICEQDGSFDGSENDESYYKVEQHSEDVYSTDNGWGLFKDESGEGRGQARKYRRTYTWNSRNQLVSSVDANYSTSYVYGQDGQRSNKYTQGSETLYFNKMWTLHTDNGNSVYGGQYAKNVYLGETRIVTKLARADQKTAHEEMYKQYYYHSDHLGSATMISDWEGKEYQRIEYTPYGETWVEKTNNSGSEFLPYRFTGKEVDQETGLYYYGARYLDPKYSMWISTDPALGEYIPEMGKGNAKDSGSLPGMGGVYNHINGNLYHYAGNNPVKFVDPDGRKMGMPDDVKQSLLNRYISHGSNVSNTDAMRMATVRSEGKYHYGMPPDKQGIVRTDPYGIYATKSGIVTSVQSGSNQSADYGNSIIVTSASDKNQVRYGHLDKIDVRIGDWVNKGQKIGIMGKTGKGIPEPNLHLHISVYPPGKACYGINAIINPEKYISRDDAWPCNTSVSTPYKYEITRSDGSKYFHEGTDFSGVNFVPNWMYGVKKEE